MKFVCQSCAREFDIGAPKGMQLPCPACGGMLGDAEDAAEAAPAPAPAPPAPTAAPSPPKAMPFEAPAEDSGADEFSLDAAEQFAAAAAAAPAEPAASAPPEPVPAPAPPAPVPAAQEYAQPETEAAEDAGEAVGEEGYEEEGYAVEGEEAFPEEGVPEEGVPEEGVPEEGFPEGGLLDEGLPEEEFLEEEEAAHPIVLMLGWILFGVALVGLLVMSYFLKEYHTQINSGVGSPAGRAKVQKLQKDLADQAVLLLSHKKDLDKETERADGLAEELKTLRAKAAKYETSSKDAVAAMKHLETELASATQALEEANRERNRLRRLAVKWETRAAHSSGQAKGAALALRAAGFLDRPALWGEALGLLDAAIRANEDLDAAWLLKGEILARVGRPKRALDAFNKVDQIARNAGAQGHARALVAAGDVCRTQLEDDRGAAMCYRRAAEAAPGSPYGRLGEIRGLILANDRVTALVKVEEGIKAAEEEDADATPLRMVRADLLAGSEGDRAEAIEAVSEVIAANPVLVPALDLRSRLLTEDEQPGAALRDLSRAAELDPSNGRRLITLGKMQLRLKQPTAAEPILQRAVELLPESVEALNALGRALLDLGRYEEAVAVLTRALRLDPDNVEAKRLRGEARVKLGRVRDGIKELEESLQHSDNVRARIVLALTYATTTVSRYRIPAKAIEHAAAAVDLTDSRDAAALSALAQGYAAGGDYPRAAIEMRKAVKLDPDKDSYKVLLRAFEKKFRR